MGIHDVLGSLSVAAPKAEGKRSDIGGSQRHIWLAHIDDEARLRAVAGLEATLSEEAAAETKKTGVEVKARRLTKDEESQAKRAEAILARGNQAPKVEAAFGPLSGLESILPQLAEKSGAVKAGSRILMSLTEAEYGDMVKVLKASGK